MSSTVMARQVEAFSYSVFQLVTDEVRGTTTPVGVAVWNTASGSYRIRLPREDERVPALNPNTRLMLEIVQDKVAAWAKAKYLPYADSEIEPNTDEWWRHVSSLLVHKIKLSQPLPIDCRVPEEEIELLFDAVVGPKRAKAERTENVQRVITKTLGSTAKKLSKGSVAGFGGRSVPLNKFFAAGSRLVIVDGVNLASSSADYDADALVSKLLRVKESQATNDRTVRPLIGYLASPNGLNGEAALVRWIETKLEAETFDLLRESDRFSESVEHELLAHAPSRYRKQ